jgi:hypothetical protein
MELAVLRVNVVSEASALPGAAHDPRFFLPGLANRTALCATQIQPRTGVKSKIAFQKCNDLKLVHCVWHARNLS